MFYEFVKFVIYSGVIVLISKYILVRTLRNLAENLNLKPKTVGDIAGYDREDGRSLWIRPEKMFLEQIPERPDNITGQKSRFELVNDFDTQKRKEEIYDRH